MTALEQVMQMKREGRTESEIIASLKSQGVPPMQISDALNQSKIKEAVTDSNPTEGMMPSIMQSEDEAPAPSPDMQHTPPESLYVPEPASQPQPPQSMQQQYSQPETSGQYAPQAQQEQYYDPYSQPQQGYTQDTFSDFAPQQDYYAGDQGYMGSTDTIIEVAEQVFQEKIKNISKELKKLTEFRTIFEQKVDNISNRLERMEKYFDKMQLEILGKVSEYGKGLDYLQKELKMVEDSVGKFSSNNRN